VSPVKYELCFYIPEEDILHSHSHENHKWYKRTEILIDASKEIGLEINVEEAKYMLVSRCQNAGQHLDKTNHLDMYKNINIWERQ
jgi:hypothetical protein